MMAGLRNPPSSFPKIPLLSVARLLLGEIENHEAGTIGSAVDEKETREQDPGEKSSILANSTVTQRSL